MIGTFQKPPLCMDARMLGATGTGVATYARSLQVALHHAGREPILLSDGSSLGDGERQGFLRRVRRGATALLKASGVVDLQERQSEEESVRLTARDIFRLAQVYFDLHGTLMPIRCALPPGIMHWTYPLPLRMEGWANLYTVHDVIPLRRPDLSPIDRHRHSRLLTQIAASADRIVTVSDTAREEIVTLLGCSSQFVVNLSQPTMIAERRHQPLPEGLKPQGYFLFCGSIEPRKNLERLMEAHRSSGVTLPLILAGPDGWRSGELARQIAEAPGVIRIPYLPRHELISLMEGARAMLFPSLAEGFGLPVIEAMAVGTPVMTSNHGALAETAGRSALLVDPIDVPAMALAIRSLADDGALCQRLREHGLERARSFTPEAFAERLARFYDSVIDMQLSDPYPHQLNG